MQDELLALSLQLSPILKKNEVVFAGLFGSHAKGTAQQHSDYDFLIEFNPHKKYTLFHLAGLKEELEIILQKPVDIVTPNGLDRYIKQEVLNSVLSFYDNR